MTDSAPETTAVPTPPAAQPAPQQPAQAVAPPPAPVAPPPVAPPPQPMTVPTPPQATAPPPVAAVSPPPAAPTAEEIAEQVRVQAQARVEVLDLARPLIDDADFDYGKSSNVDILKAALGKEYVEGSNEDQMLGHVRAIASARRAASDQSASPLARDQRGRFTLPEVAPYGFDASHPGYRDRLQAYNHHIQDMQKTPRQHRFERRAEASGMPIQQTQAFTR